VLPFHSPHPYSVLTQCVTQELRRLFHTYIGALYIRAGSHTIQQWISPLIDSDAVPLVSEPPQPHDSGQNWLAPPPPGFPPPLPGYSTNAPNGSPSNPVTLALVNETAVKNKVTLTYLAEREGEPHQPTWTVKCCSKQMSPNLTAV
jgi:dsRNA-specific ribonuclease